MPQVLVAISQKFYCIKEAWAMQKLFRKKRKKVEKKMDTKVFEILKTIGT